MYVAKSCGTQIGFLVNETFLDFPSQKRYFLECRLPPFSFTELRKGVVPRGSRLSRAYSSCLRWCLKVVFPLPLALAVEWTYFEDGIVVYWTTEIIVFFKIDYYSSRFA